MLTYIIRRIGIGLVTLILITFIVFGLIRNMPGTPLTFQLGESNPEFKMSDADLERLEKIYGLDKPWYEAYFQWLGNLVRGNLGHSVSQKRPVAQLIGERIGPTMLLSIPSLMLTYLLAVPMGLFATVRSGKLDERTMSTTLYMLYSFPAFVAALFLQVFFAVKLEGTAFSLPLFGMKSIGYDEMTTWGKTVDIFKHMILPVTCYTYTGLAFYSRFVKANMEEVIRQDYIRTARAKGVAPFNVIVHHAFRNTLIPFVTMIGLMLPALVSGSVILEQIFNWPGMGRAFFDSLVARDYPMLMGLMLMFSTLTLLGQLLADILYAVVDPRISYS